MNRDRDKILERNVVVTDLEGSVRNMGPSRSLPVIEGRGFSNELRESDDVEVLDWIVVVTVILWSPLEAIFISSPLENIPKILPLSDPNSFPSSRTTDDRAVVVSFVGFLGGC